MKNFLQQTAHRRMQQTGASGGQRAAAPFDPPPRSPTVPTVSPSSLLLSSVSSPSPSPLRSSPSSSPSSSSSSSSLLMPPSPVSSSLPLPSSSTTDDDDGSSCMICLAEPLITPTCLSHCSHIFCFTCIEEWGSNYDSRCPACRTIFLWVEKITDSTVRFKETTKDDDGARATTGKYACGKGSGSGIQAKTNPKPPKKLTKKQIADASTQHPERTYFAFKHQKDLPDDDDAADVLCEICERGDDPDYLLLCDECANGYHTWCVGLFEVPEGDWFCPTCRQNRNERQRSALAQSQTQTQPRLKPQAQVASATPSASKGQSTAPIPALSPSSPSALESPVSTLPPRPWSPKLPSSSSSPFSSSASLFSSTSSTPAAVSRSVIPMFSASSSSSSPSPSSSSSSSSFSSTSSSSSSSCSSVPPSSGFELDGEYRRMRRNAVLAQRERHNMLLSVPDSSPLSSSSSSSFAFSSSSSASSLPVSRAAATRYFEREADRDVRRINQVWRDIQFRESRYREEQNMLNEAQQWRNLLKTLQEKNIVIPLQTIGDERLRKALTEFYTGNNNVSSSASNSSSGLSSSSSSSFSSHSTFTSSSVTSFSGPSSASSSSVSSFPVKRRRISESFGGGRGLYNDDDEDDMQRRMEYVSKSIATRSSSSSVTPAVSASVVSSSSTGSSSSYSALKSASSSSSSSSSSSPSSAVLPSARALMRGSRDSRDTGGLPAFMRPVAEVAANTASRIWALSDPPTPAGGGQKRTTKADRSEGFTNSGVEAPIVSSRMKKKRSTRVLRDEQQDQEEVEEEKATVKDLVKQDRSRNSGRSGGGKVKKEKKGEMKQEEKPPVAPFTLAGPASAGLEGFDEPWDDDFNVELLKYSKGVQSAE